MKTKYCASVVYNHHLIKSNPELKKLLNKEAKRPQLNESSPVKDI